MGPFATNAGDLALAYQTLAGPHAADALSQHQPSPHTHAFSNTADLSDLRIGVYWPWSADSSPEVFSLFNATLQHYVQRGAKVVPVSIPFLDVYNKALGVTITSEMAIFLDAHHETNEPTMGSDTQIILNLARTFSSRDFLAAQQVRTRALKELARVFADADVILTPGTPITAPLIAEDALKTGESNITLTTTLMRYMFLANLAGIPGITFPVGYDAHGLPISVQAMAPHWHEHVLLRLAHAAEAATALKQPHVFYDVLNGAP